MLKASKVSSCLICMAQLFFEDGANVVSGKGSVVCKDIVGSPDVILVQISGNENLRSLKMIELFRCSERGEHSVKQAVEAHPNHPNLTIRVPH